MNFIKTKLKDVILFYPNVFSDERGTFIRHFCINELNKQIKFKKCYQANISFNKKKATLRGFHYQTDPYQEDKIVSCLVGEIYDVIIDLRVESKTYLKHQGFYLNDINKKSLVVPKGFAHSFLTLKSNTTVHYYTSQVYYSKYERGIRYNDPLFNIKWPIKPKYISNKDQNFSDY